MHLKVMAEGVENGPQVSFLKDRHCNEVQGYYVSRPLAVTQAEAFLRGYNAHVPGVEDFLTVFKPAYGR
jgi:EAL domain-containing protein (putative c-di-GMP-specific phosphodiesterase class I)